jgi:hypothetical protein
MLVLAAAGLLEGSSGVREIGEGWGTVSVQCLCAGSGCYKWSSGCRASFSRNL